MRADDLVPNPFLLIGGLIMLRDPRTVLERYDRLSDQQVEKYRRLICAADNRLGTYCCFHLCHNWGNDASRAVLARYDRLSSRMTKRRTAEYDRSEHFHHHGP